MTSGPAGRAGLIHVKRRAGPRNCPRYRKYGDPAGERCSDGRKLLP